MRYCLFLCFGVFLFSITHAMDESSYPTQGKRYDAHGWIHVMISGEPYQRGFQHGSLLAKEYQHALECYKAMTYETSGITYDYLSEQANRILTTHIPPEYLEEMRGIADGCTDAGVPASLEDIIGWNFYLEMIWNWWPNHKDHYLTSLSAPAPGRCSAFIATGSATKDGQIVMGHSSFDSFWNVQYSNCLLHVFPSEGHSFVMQTTPGYISSLTDFFINDAGIMATETSLAGFSPFTEEGIPYFIRTRKAIQYSSSITGFVETLSEGNNGGAAATWLIGDSNTQEIAQFEQGLLFQHFEIKKNGYFYGFNAPFDPRIRYLETSDTGFNDIRQSTGGRRCRWEQLCSQYNGQITLEVGKKMLSDHFDCYQQITRAGNNTICCHSDEDPSPSVSSVPFSPFGCVDGKITTSALAKEMKCAVRWGRACGTPFYAKNFLEKHPQWNWQQLFLQDRPAEPWIIPESMQPD